MLADPGFGRHFTDHMASARWTVDGGWSDFTISAAESFTLHPGAAVFHYGQEIFEGLKAYRHPDGGLWLFRPDLNARRFAHSAERLAMPPLPEDVFVDSIRELVRADADWVPEPTDEQSLYLRPFMIADEPFIGVRPAQSYRYAVIASPAGPYFPSGVTGIRLWVTDQFTRAAPGGTGSAKSGGNYAGSLAAQIEAREHGCEQVLYLDGTERKWLEESGTMNIFLVTRDGELITPGLGTILEGVTRDSVLALADTRDLEPVERRIGLDELRHGITEGDITEVFAAGTAAVITPIDGLRGEGYDLTVGSGQPGSTTIALRSTLLDIQYGRTAAPDGWMQPVGEIIA